MICTSYQKIFLFILINQVNNLFFNGQVYWRYNFTIHLYSWLSKEFNIFPIFHYIKQISDIVMERALIFFSFVISVYSLELTIHIRTSKSIIDTMVSNKNVVFQVLPYIQNYYLVYLASRRSVLSPTRPFSNPHLMYG